MNTDDPSASQPDGLPDAVPPLTDGNFKIHSTTRPGSRWQPPAPEELQAQLPQYRVFEILGCGGMGAVYKGWQVSLDRYVAIKILPPHVDEGDEQFTARFKQEAKTMARFQHPGIVSVYDAGETPGGLLYIVMEFIEGTDVALMTRAQGKLPAEYALAITAHVCDALQYAHSHGVIHRDIKPANVLINMEGAVKVADFGLAKASDLGQTALTKEDVTMGTPDYLAPEGLIMGIQLDGRADLYAVGVMLYHMLTGQLPRGRFEMPSALTQGATDVRFDDIISRAMEQDREKRYQSAEEMRADLDVIISTPLLLADGSSSAAIPKQALARAHEHRVSRKPMARRPGELAVRPGTGRVPAGQPAQHTVTYVPQRKSVVPAFLIGALLVTCGFLAWLIFGNHPATERSLNAASLPVSGHASAAPSPTAALLPEGVLTFGGHRYKFLPGPFSKNEELAVATALGGHVLTISSAEEHKWIEQAYRVLVAMNVGGKCRIGGTKTADGSWSWRSSEKWGYENWAAGFPTSRSDQTYLILKSEIAGLFWQNTYWSDKGSTIIEWDDSTTPIPLEPLSAPLASATPASADAILFGGHRYKLVRGFLHWEEARNQAMAMGGHLVTLNSREEDEWVRKTFVDPLQAERMVHIGAYKPLDSNQWMWVTGEPWGIENWRKPQETTESRGAYYQNIAGGKSQWVAFWNPTYRVAIASGPEEGDQRSVGFLVEWDSERVASPAPTAPTTLAADGTTQFGGHRYQVVTERLKWTDAKARAEAMGGHLATVTSREERDALSGAVRTSLGSQHVWIGGWQEKAGGAWTWITGEPFDPGLWGESGPDGSGRGLAFHCPSTKKHWDDVSSDQSHNFMVEWDSAAPLPAAPDAGALTFQDSRYKFVPDRTVTWTQAKAKAEALGGHLATITSKEEHDWIALNMIVKLDLGQGVWVGGTNQGSPTQWRWVTGEPFAFTAWNRGEPTNNTKEIGLIFTRNDYGDLGWGDLDENRKDRAAGYLVEWDDKAPVPAASAPALAAAAPAINLLSTVDLKRDVVRNAWEMKPDGLSTSPKEGSNQVLEFNITAPEEYDYEIEFTITTGTKELVQILPVPKGSILFQMGPYSGDPAAYGFGGNLDGAALKAPRTEAMAFLPRLKNGQRYRCLVEVRKGTLRAVLDGREIVKWSGDFARFAPTSWAELPNKKHVGIGAYNTAVTFHKAELRFRGLVPDRLAQLEAQFKEAWERDVTKGTARPIADLDGKYLAALDRTITEATKAGRLDDVVALREEKRRVCEQAPLPATDPANTVASLKKLRDTYRTTSAPLIKLHDAATKHAIARYDAALEAFQMELTQKNRLDDALFVKSRRGELDRLRRPVEPIASAPTSLVAAALPPAPEAAPKPEALAPPASPKAPASKTLSEDMLKEAPQKPFTQEEAIHWALTLNGSAKILRGKQEEDILSAGFIPKGKYLLIGLKIGESQPLRPASLAGLAKLTDLRELSLSHNLITDAGLAFLPPLPKLTTLHLSACELTDAAFTHLAKQTALTQLSVGGNKINGTGLELLPAAMALQTLAIGSSALTDDGVRMIARRTSLTALDLTNCGNSKTTSFAPLAALTNLKSFRLRGNATDILVQSLSTVTQIQTLDLVDSPITDFAFDRIAMMTSLRALLLSNCRNVTDSGYLKLVPLGRNIATLHAGQTRLGDTGLKALCDKLTEIKELDISSTGVSGAGLVHLGNLRSITSLSISAAQCTDEGIRGLARVTANPSLQAFGVQNRETLSKERQEALRRMTIRYVY